MLKDKQNYYEILGVSSQATIEEIKTQRNRMLQAHHPDHNKSSSANERTKQIHVAWETLSDPARRHEYDEAMKPQPRSSTICRKPTRVHRRVNPRQPSRRASGKAHFGRDYDIPVWHFHTKIPRDSMFCKDWADELNPNSKTTLFSFLKYLEWVKQNGYWKTATQMLDDHAKCLRSTNEKIGYKHLDR